MTPKASQQLALTIIVITTITISSLFFINKKVKNITYVKFSSISLPDPLFRKIALETRSQEFRSSAIKRSKFKSSEIKTLSYSRTAQNTYSVLLSIQSKKAITKNDMVEFIQSDLFTPIKEIRTLNNNVYSYKSTNKNLQYTFNIIFILIIAVNVIFLTSRLTSQSHPQTERNH